MFWLEWYCKDATFGMDNNIEKHQQQKLYFTLAPWALIDTICFQATLGAKGLWLLSERSR